MMTNQKHFTFAKLTALLLCFCFLLPFCATGRAAANDFDTPIIGDLEGHIRVTLSVSGHAGEVILEPTEDNSFSKGATVFEVMQKVFAEKGIAYTLKNEVYVSEIAGLAEFDYGKYSGWMYMVGGAYPNVPMCEYRLQGGEEILIKYVESFEPTSKTDISSALVSGIAPKAYTGKALTQSPQVTFENTRLTAGTDYKIRYENNVKVGTATVCIDGIGQFKGSIKKTFAIVLGKAKPKVAAVSAAAVKLTWSKVPGAAYYRVYDYNTKLKKYTAVEVVKTNSVVIKKLAAGSTHYYLVKSCFKNKAGKEVCSAFTAADCLKAVVLCKAPAAKAAAAGKTVTLKWAKCTGAQYYRVYRYNLKTKKYTTLVSKTTALSVKLTKQAKGSNYYLVRAFNAAGGSAYSAKNQVKVVVK
ncbi:MAG: DUF4430 domain-containing protein [Clostridia bacterium]|nr:DUF4430 domain-containing protein [Clostridia bacterium]